jgi:hypothetical protein
MNKKLEKGKGEPTKEELEKQIDPTLLPLMKQFWDEGGK